MSAKRSESLPEFIEGMLGFFGALLIGACLGTLAASLVPGVDKFAERLYIALLIGVALVLLSYLVFRNPVLLLGRIVEALLYAILFAWLAILPTLIRSPENAPAWLLVVTSVALGVLLIRLQARVRDVVDSRPL